MSIRQEIAIRKRDCHVCGSVINKGEKYIRLSSNYKNTKENKNDNYNTGSNICSYCVIYNFLSEKLSHILVFGNNESKDIKPVRFR